ncbi:hypothetical protein ACKFKG_28230 [Phormidesmis sp. 146-35]
MSNVSPASPLGPLSVGNVVSTGIRIYRSHFKQYLILSLITYLWIFVPVFGWAKMAAISGLISRHAYAELINQPESIRDARRFTNSRIWRFFVASILLGLIFIGLYIGIVIVLALVFGLSALVGPIGVLFGIVGTIAALIVLIRIYSRWFVYDVAIAVEENIDATTSLSRSWDLTEGAVGRIQWVVFVAFLVSLVVQIPTQVLSTVLQIFIPSDPSSVPVLAVFVGLAVLVVLIVSSALVMPFWQVIKAVIYYDLRARREGLGLQLRDR